MSLNSDSAGERQRHGKREGHADRAAETEEKEELMGRESGGRGIQRAENRNAVGQREREGRGGAGEEAEGWESTLSALWFPRPLPHLTPTLCTCSRRGVLRIRYTAKAGPHALRGCPFSLILGPHMDGQSPPALGWRRMKEGSHIWSPSLKISNSFRTRLHSSARTLLWVRQTPDYRPVC